MNLIAANRLRSPFGIDLLTPLSAEQYRALFASGIVSWVGHYLGTAIDLPALLGSGLAFLPIAGEARVGGWSAGTGLTDASATIAAARALSLPIGATIWLDLEAPANNLTVDAANAYAAAHGRAIQSVGDQAGIYAGAGCPLDGAQLYALPQTAYAQACSEGYVPRCGFQWIQAHPGDQPCAALGGARVDWGMLAQDYSGRWPVLVSA